MKVIKNLISTVILGNMVVWMSTSLLKASEEKNSLVGEEEKKEEDLFDQVSLLMLKLQELHLTEAQKQKILEITQQHQEELLPHMETLKEGALAFLAHWDDPEAMKTEKAKLKEAKRALSDVRLKILEEFRVLATPQQKEIIDQWKKEAEKKAKKRAKKRPKEDFPDSSINPSQ